MDKETILPSDELLRNEDLYSDLPPLRPGTSVHEYITDFTKTGGGAEVLESDDDVVAPLLIW